MSKIQLILASITALLCKSGFAHEQWLLTASEIEQLKKMPPPSLFTQLTSVNMALSGLALICLTAWVIFNYRYPKPYKKGFPNTLGLALLSLRFWTGLMLCLCALGLMPKIGLPYFDSPTLLAPDLLISADLNFVRWLELILGISFIVGFYTRLSSVLFLGLQVFAACYFGKDYFQYLGFYLAIALFLLIHGGGKYSLDKTTIQISYPALFIAQLFTGLNFIYSAISIKLFAPNLDIAIIENRNAFTFGIPVPEFVFIMLIVELLFGLCFLLGWRLPLLSSLLLGLFIFLGISLSENLLAHSFIYGLLTLFFLLGGTPLQSRQLR
ncbi:DoxX family protein [Legionella genomosp. 1]|uniref:DoxX family protein n=1 Tax=Legionella genomosp. 1 TaxID=1093625 RepID=UPI001054F2EF|nr:TQO small subunit DoxD [Legionella genomosp. 1]